MVTWSGFQFQQEHSSNQSQQTQPFKHLRDVILLDTRSTLKVTFMNPDLVTDIHVTKTPVDECRQQED
jgi:hypothetical protein